MDDSSTIDSLFTEAVNHHQAGRYAEAEPLYRKILTQSPRHADANYNLGVLATQMGSPEQGLPFFMSAWESDPEVSQYWIALGECLINVGRVDDAVNVLESAIKNGLDSVEMEALLTRAQGGLANPAESAVPPPTEKNLSELTDLYHAGHFSESVAYAQNFIKRWPDQVLGWNTLAGSFAALNKLQEAEATCRQAIDLIPNNASLHSDLGAILSEMGRYADAEVSCRQALELQPDRAETLNNLGDNLHQLGRLIEAKSYLLRALEIKPEYPDAYHNLGIVLMDLGLPQEADKSYQRALAYQPDFVKTLHNRLFCFNYRPDMSAEEVFKWYKRYGEGVTQQVAGKVIKHGQWSWDGKRRLRIGYVSPDYRGHACRFFMEPFLREHNRDEFELFAYSNMPLEDQHTKRLKGYFDHWRDIFRLQDDAAAALIDTDKIDILVDLAGHTAGNRLRMFARKPAPVQLTYLGYDNTTGLTEIDYFLADEQLVPTGSGHLFSEKIWRLPVSLCYEPPRELTPEVGPLPALRNGFVTFGSMLRVMRLNEDVIRVWSDILKRVPNSCLRLYQEPFKYADMQHYFSHRFERYGIDPERIVPEHLKPHWGGYNEFDIALDAFPNNGGATTLEALWMGVPVLTMQGRPGVGLYGASLLHPVGLNDWITNTEEAYIDQAVSAANDLTGLGELRATLRQRFENSPLQDVPTFTRSLEKAYREIVECTLAAKS